jgi:hypothetical protein
MENVIKSNNIFDPTTFFDDNSSGNVDLDHLIIMLLIKTGEIIYINLNITHGFILGKDTGI